MGFKHPFIGWVELSGFPKFTTTMIPFIMGSVLAWSEYQYPVPYINLPVLVCSLIAVFLLTDFCFVLNACSVYTDLKSKDKSKGKGKGLQFHVKTIGSGSASSLHSTAVSGRFNALESGLISVKQAVRGAYMCLVAAIPLSLILRYALHTGVLTLPLGVLGILVAYSYSRGPRLSYIGWGELALTVGVGWLTVFSGYYLQAGHVSWLPTIVALPWMIDVFKLKLTRELPDFECDASIGRRTLAVRLGKRKTIALYLPLTICSWVSFIPLLWLNIPYYGLLLLILPALYTAKSLRVVLHKRDLKDEELNALTKNAFTGMILIPVALTGIFGMKILLNLLAYS